MQNWVIIRSYGNRNDAQLTVALLESCGIEAMVNGDDLGGQKDYLGFTFGINVLTTEERKEEALAILADAENAASKDNNSPKTVHVFSKRVRLLRNLTGFVWFIAVAYWCVIIVLQTKDYNRDLVEPLVGMGLVFGSSAVLIVYLRERNKELDRRRQIESEKS